jgi:hypothetical protein
MKILKIRLVKADCRGYVKRAPHSISRLGVTYKSEFGLEDWIYCTLCVYTTRDYRQYSAIAILRTFSSLGFSVFISRILATDL